MNLLYMPFDKRESHFCLPRIPVASFFFHYPLKVRKSQKQFIVYSILPKNEQKSRSWASSLIILRIVIFCSLFERIAVTIICFRDFLNCSLLKILIDLAKNNQNFYGAFAHCFKTRKNFCASIALYYIVCDSVKALCLGFAIVLHF